MATTFPKQEVESKKAVPLIKKNKGISLKHEVTPLQITHS
jgi:hypothetical protein